MTILPKVFECYSSFFTVAMQWRLCLKSACLLLLLRRRRREKWQNEIGYRYINIPENYYVLIIRNFYNRGHKYLRKCETRESVRYFYRHKNVLISSGKLNGVKIRIWSKSLSTRLLRTTGFIEIP